MKVSQNGLNLIKQFEGFEPIAKPCIAGVPTIGYGTIRYPNGTKVKNGERITVQQAESCLSFEVASKTDCINIALDRYAIWLTQNEFDAVASFIYNLGEGMLCLDHDFGIALKSGKRSKIASTMLQYCKYKGLFGIMRTSKGLLNRRKAEVELFLKKD
jgi:lysozyme